MRKKLLFPVGICILLLSFLLVGVASSNPQVTTSSTLALAALENAAEGDKACSAIAVGVGATRDGSTLNGYTCDGTNDYRLRIVPAADHPAGSTYYVDYTGVEGNEHYNRGSVPQAAHTYQWFDIEVPVANEKQLFINENTDSSWTGLRDEGYDTETGSGAYVFDWHSLMAIVLQRAETASQGIDVLAEMVETYGMRGNAESFMITDPTETWIVEVAGWSKMWLAQRLPDNAVAFHANRLRLQGIEVDNPDFRYAKDANGEPAVISTAAARVITDASHPKYVEGETNYYYEPERDGEFDFEKIYSTESSRKMWGNARREWMALTLLCPSVEWDPLAESYPVWVVPEFKVTAEWIMDTLWKNVYEGTKYSLLEGPSAGPYNMADRASVSVPEGLPAVAFERPIGTQTQTYCTVGVGREWVPDELGLMWFSNNIARTGIFTPVYVSTTRLPGSWHDDVAWETDEAGTYVFKYDPASIWWQFQALKTLCNFRYKDMIADVRNGFTTGRGIVTEYEGFDAIDKGFRDAQTATERDAEALQGAARVEFLTDYTFEAAETTEAAVRHTLAGLLTKYKNGPPATEISSYWANLYQEDNPNTYTTIRSKAEVKALGYYYEVTFDPNGGTFSGPNQAAVNSDGKLIKRVGGVNSKNFNIGVALPTPTLAGRTFNGWYNGNTKYEAGTPITSDTTLTASWQ